MKSVFSHLIVLSVFVSPHLVFAEDTNFYVEGSLGSASHETGPFDDDDTSFGLTAGIQINPYFGAEISYYDFGEMEFELLGTDLTTEATTLDLAAVGSVPLSPQFSIYGKLGLAFWDVEASAPGASASTDGTDLFFGLGAKFNITEQVYVGGEFTSYTFEDDGDYDVDNLAVKVGFKF